MSSKSTLKKVMRLAWQLATNAMARFGGKKSEYFAECLKDAWKKVKEFSQPIPAVPTKPRVYSSVPVAKKTNTRKNSWKPGAYHMDPIWKTVGQYKM